MGNTGWGCDVEQLRGLSQEGYWWIAALTAELAAQSEKTTAAVCDQPPGLDELAGHIEAPNMRAGGSHPQATMMPDPWATYKRPSTEEGQTANNAPPEITRLRAQQTRAPSLSQEGSVKLDPGQPHEMWRREA